LFSRIVILPFLFCLQSWLALAVHDDATQTLDRSHSGCELLHQHETLTLPDHAQDFEKSHTPSLLDLQNHVERVFEVDIHQVYQGATSKVFLVTRQKDRNTPEPPKFAVKIPTSEYYKPSVRKDAEIRKKMGREAFDPISLAFITVLAEDLETGAFMMPWSEFTVSSGMIEGLIPIPALSLFEHMEVWDRFLERLNLMHERGILHQDIKPENIFMVINNGFVEYLLTDFGHSLDNFNDLGEQEKIKIAGTPHYIPPRQIRSPVLEPSNDIFAVRISIIESLLRIRLTNENSVLPLYYELFKGIPMGIPRLKRSVENLIETKLALALHHPSKNVREFRDVIGLAMYFHLKPSSEFLKRYGRTFLAPLAVSDPALAGETIFTSPTLTEAFPYKLGLSTDEAQKIIDATTESYRNILLKQEQVPAGYPNPWLDKESLYRSQSKL